MLKGHLDRAIHHQEYYSIRRKMMKKEARDLCGSESPGKAVQLSLKDFRGSVRVLEIAAGPAFPDSESGVKWSN